MTRYTQKQLREMVKFGIAEDVTYFGTDQYEMLLDNEGFFRQIGYSSGVYGCNGMLLQGNNTKTLYAVTQRTSAIFIFG